MLGLFLVKMTPPTVWARSDAGRDDNKVHSITQQFPPPPRRLTSPVRRRRSLSGSPPHDAGRQPSVCLPTQEGRDVEIVHVIRTYGPRQTRLRRAVGAR